MVAVSEERGGGTEGGTTREAVVRPRGEEVFRGNSGAAVAAVAARKDPAGQLLAWRLDDQLEEVEEAAESARVVRGAVGRRRGEEGVVDPRGLRVEGLLGVGSFGRVVLAREGSRRYALKAASKRAAARHDRGKRLTAERAAHLRLAGSAWIVDFVCAFDDRDFAFLLFEWLPCGDLYEYVYAETKKRPTRFLVANVVAGLEHAHGREVAWRDLKPENLLFDSRGYLKLSDFGSSKLDPGETALTLCGTPEYAAPEIVLGAGHGKAVDCWSLGVLAYELRFAATPFAAAEPLDVFRNVLDADARLADARAWPAPPAFVALVLELLHSLPAFRLGNLAGGIAQIKDHAWFAACPAAWTDDDDPTPFDWAALAARTIDPPLALHPRPPLATQPVDALDDAAFRFDSSPDHLFRDWSTLSSPSPPTTLWSPADLYMHYDALHDDHVDPSTEASDDDDDDDDCFISTS